jgi:hypothetical protein
MLRLSGSLDSNGENESCFSTSASEETTRSWHDRVLQSVSLLKDFSSKSIESTLFVLGEKLSWTGEFLAMLTPIAKLDCLKQSVDYLNLCFHLKAVLVKSRYSAITKSICPCLPT